MNGWSRLLIVAVGMAAFVWFVTPLLHNAFNEAGRQMDSAGWDNRNHTGITPYGYTPRQDSYAATWRDRPNNQAGTATWDAPAYFPAQADGRQRGGDRPQGGYERCFYDGQHLVCESGRR